MGFHLGSIYRVLCALSGDDQAKSTISAGSAAVSKKEPRFRAQAPGAQTHSYQSSPFFVVSTGNSKKQQRRAISVKLTALGPTPVCNLNIAQFRYKFLLVTAMNIIVLWTSNRFPLGTGLRGSGALAISRTGFWRFAPRPQLLSCSQRHLPTASEHPCHSKSPWKTSPLESCIGYIWEG